MLSPFDDYPIHPGAEPIAHPATGDPNHYDRYFFNGHSKEGTLFFGGAMGHYPVRGVVDAAFSIVVNGVEHSVFASGRMPLDRSTEVGPIRVEVIEPIRVVRLVVEPNEHDIACDLTFRATTVAVEEPRQRIVSPEGLLTMDNTRLTQWGTWEGSVVVDGTEIPVELGSVPGTRDRSWGTRAVGPRVPTNWEPRMPSAFWLWAPLHFEDRFVHLALHEYPDGTRWLETAMVLDPISEGAAPWSTAGVQLCRDIEYDLVWKPGTREITTATIGFVHPTEGEVSIQLENLYTFRMRGIGYAHPNWSHGSYHGELETGRESIALTDFDPTDFLSLHIQNVVTATMGDRTGVGVFEQACLGPHAPTGLTGLADGHA